MGALIHVLLKMVALQAVTMHVEAVAQLFALITAQHLVLLIVSKCAQIVVVVGVKRHQRLQWQPNLQVLVVADAEHSVVMVVVVVAHVVPHVLVCVL